jgi:hypothetical protein
VGGLDIFGAGKIGDGAADFKDAAVGAGAQAQFVDGGFKKFLRVLIHGAIALDIARAHLRVGVDGPFLKPSKLDVARVIDALANRFRGFAGIAAGKILVAYRRHFDLNVDPIEERARYARAVALDLQRRADAFLLWIGKKTAGARIHCSNQHNGGGIIDRAQGARDGDVAVFERLAHDLEHVAPEFRQFVEEQDPVTAPLDRPILVLRVALPQGLK